MGNQSTIMDNNVKQKYVNKFKNYADLSSSQKTIKKEGKRKMKTEVQEEEPSIVSHELEGIEIEDLQCGICLQYYDTRKKKPIQYCPEKRHNMCQECLMGILRGVARCPFCKREINPRNRTLNRKLNVIADIFCEQLSEIDPEYAEVYWFGRKNGSQKIIKAFKNKNIAKNLDQILFIKMNKKNIEKMSCVQKLRNLKFLNLSNNLIRKIEKLKSLQHLNSINLSHNNIRHIEKLENLKNLEDLDLSNNQIESMKEIRYLSNLKKLNLENNLIDLFELSKNLDCLSELKLFGNPLRKKSMEEISAGQWFYLAIFSISFDGCRTKEQQDECYLLFTNHYDNWTSLYRASFANVVSEQARKKIYEYSNQLNEGFEFVWINRIG